jgi:hypothetical protein
MQCNHVLPAVVHFHFVRFFPQCLQLSPVIFLVEVFSFFVLSICLSCLSLACILLIHVLLLRLFSIRCVYSFVAFTSCLFFCFFFVSDSFTVFSALLVRNNICTIRIFVFISYFISFLLFLVSLILFGRGEQMVLVGKPER